MSKILDGFTQPEVSELVAELRVKLQEMKHHRVFPLLRTMEDLRIFMAWHVFAVWDFMTFAKRLQYEYTCTRMPWIPPKNKKSARHINEIILGEESDEDGKGGHCSHYELYLRSMTEVGTSTDQIEQFVREMVYGAPASDAMKRAQVPEAVQAFVNANLKMARAGSVEEVLGGFIFGREDSIPEMFQDLLNNWGIRENKAPSFVFYLKRHIELDGDVHGPASFEMLMDEVGTDVSRLKKALEAAVKAVDARIALWEALATVLTARV